MNPIKKLEERIKDLESSIKEWHLPYKDEEENKNINKVKELMEFVEYWEFTSDEDLIWIQAKIRAFEEAINIIKGK